MSGGSEIIGTGKEHGRKGSRALVTGGAGFLGTHLCERLLLDGYEVIALDNFHTGRIDNLAGIAENPAFSCVRHEIVEALPGDFAIDAIYNFACPASPAHYQTDPIHTFKTSVLG